MSRLRPLVLAALAVLALAVIPAAATAMGAAQTLTPIKDCQLHNGKLTQKYTAAELTHALNSLAPGVRDYTTCNAAIQDELDSINGTTYITAGGNGSGGGGSGTVILIIVVVAVILLGGGGALWAYGRNRGTREDDEG